MSSRNLSPRAYAHTFDERIAVVLPHAARTSPAFGRRLAAAGVAPDELTDVQSLDRIPVLGKDHLLDEQQAQPPLGGLLAPGAALRRIFQSPGPLYEPELARPDPWRWASGLRAAGFTSADVVINCFSYHLSPAGAMFEEACRAIGAAVLPAGVGNLDLQAQACDDLQVTAYIGLPSYLKSLLDKADELGLDLCLQRAFVTAEPFPPSLRAQLQDKVASVREGFGTAETGNLGYESDALDGFHVPDDALVQICDLTTGEALYDTREGQVVVTLFDRDYPLVRFGTGDLSSWAEPTDAEGLLVSAEPHDAADHVTPRIRGWLGRVGEAVKVRGLFLHPRQVRRALEDAEGVVAFRMVVDRSNDRDKLRCEVVPGDGAESGRLEEDVAARIRSALRFRVDVELVDSLSEGTEVIDDRRRWD